MQGKKLFQRTLLGATCAIALAGTTGSALAANWLMLQGTEPEGASARAEVWGFIQAQYSKDFSDANAAGAYVPPKLLGPDLDSQAGFNVNRARIGARGTGFPLDGRINYFALLEMGNNGITKGTNTFAKMTDASITLNYIPGARIRAGLFKTPGAEEGLQAIHVFDYINFTEASNALLNERFPNRSFTNSTGVSNTTNTGNVAAMTQAQLQGNVTGTSGYSGLDAFATPVGAFRDVGVQVFDAFDMGNDWEVSYAAMIGNGSGVEFKNSDGKFDKYLYVSGEKKLGGKGAKAEGLKFFAWGQWGERLLDTTDDLTANLKTYKRDRAGLGVKYMNKPFRVTAEYITANGMIFEGPDKPNYYFTRVVDGNGADAKANGWYVEGGWYIPNTKWELDARFDTMTRNTDRANQHTFDKWTLGVQYHFNPKTRLTVNYEMRDFKCDSGRAPCTSAGAATPNYNLDGVGDKVGVQLTAIF